MFTFKHGFHFGEVARNLLGKQTGSWNLRSTPAPGPGMQSSTIAAVEARAMHLPLDASIPRVAFASVSNPAPKMGITKGPATVLAPLSQERFRLQATLGREGRDALIEAQRLSGHSAAAKADLAQVIEEAIIAHHDKLAARKFGIGKSERACKQGMQVPADLRCAQQDSQTVPLSTTLSSAAPMATAAAAAAVRADAEAALPPGIVNRSASHAPEHAAQRDAQPCADTDKPQVALPKPGNPRYIPRALRLRCKVHRDRQTRLDFGEAKIIAAIEARKKHNSQREFRPLIAVPAPAPIEASTA